MRILLSVFLVCCCSLTWGTPTTHAKGKSETLSKTLSQNTAFHPKSLWLDNNGIFINAHGGGMYYEKGTYYWFGEHKIEGVVGNLAHVGVHCYSSKDLYNWKDEGIALSVIKDQPGHPISQGCILERPKVIYNKKTRKYVMWFHLEELGKGYSCAHSGVAIANKVTGPYTFLHAERANAKKWPLNLPKSDQTLLNAPTPPQLQGSFFPKDMNTEAFLKRDFNQGQMARDMTLFVDSDGKAYQFYSSEENGVMQISQLSDDYTHHSGRFTRQFIGRFMEAPAVCKRKGKYYLIASGCSGWAPNKARMAVSNHILGPWKELDCPCVGTGSENTFKGQSTFILPVVGKKDAYIFMADEWHPENAIDGRYIWLPMTFDGDQIKIEWKDVWDLSHFDK